MIQGNPFYTYAATETMFVESAVRAHRIALRSTDCATYKASSVLHPIDMKRILKCNSLLTVALLQSHVNDRAGDVFFVAVCGVSGLNPFASKKMAIWPRRAGYLKVGE